MKKENNIDNYFSRVKQNPPLMDIEQVRQVITEAEVKVETEAKVNKGHRNLLKCTIMTTIFAAIISAVLLWTGGGSNTKYKVQSTKYQDAIQEKVSSIKYQDTRPFGGDSNSTNTNSANSNYAGTKNDESTNDNKLLDIANENESESGLAPNQPNEVVGSIEKSTQSAQQNLQQPLGFDPDSIQPIDGSRFIIKLKPEEIERLGFLIEGQSVHYKKMTPQWNIEFIMNIFPKGSEFRSIRYTEAETKESIAPSSFFPVFESDMRFFVKSGAERNFESINDTLIPIQIPLNQISEGKYEDDLFWFTVNGNLIEVLPSNYKGIAKEIMELKTIKKVLPEKNIVFYNPKSIYEGVNFIELSKEELQKFGFSYTNKISYSVFIGSTSFKFEIDSVYKVEAKNIFRDTPKKVPIPVAISDERGRFLHDLFDLTRNNKLDFGKCIPIKISTTEEKLFIKQYFVMWFYPSEAFFKALPERISNDLRKEYNYITAEDKSQLVKPECKYFDECKNTLDASKFKVFPNPANNTATVSFTLNEAITGRITLVDLAGREKQVLQPNTNYSKGSHQFDVDVSNVPEGIYLLTLYSDKGVQTQRVIVAR